ncbi:hypothetical protein M514_08136 [Trichuris suis]|uniref:Uncharacterized protein n=1 Tax=Trichuris suis TaxID=68888 RepID=A0A085NQY3_9BILA|nr:hypothetical protein M514_08136 [Trichuris suis]
METPAVIINELCQGIPPSVSAELPSTAAMSLMIRRSRRAVQAPPPLPTSLASIIIPEAYKTYGGEAFLLYDSGLGDEERILIFGRPSFGEWSCHMKNTFGDGRSYGRQSFGRQVVWPTGRMADRSFNRQVVWPTGRLVDWSFDRQVVWPTRHFP